MGWPQWIVIGFMLLGLGIALAKHGEPRSPFSFWSALIGQAITWWLLWMGGFWS